MDSKKLRNERLGKYHFRDAERTIELVKNEPPHWKTSRTPSALVFFNTSTANELLQFPATAKLRFSHRHPEAPLESTKMFLTAANAAGKAQKLEMDRLGMSLNKRGKMVQASKKGKSPSRALSNSMPPSQSTGNKKNSMPSRKASESLKLISRNSEHDTVITSTSCTDDDAALSVISPHEESRQKALAILDTAMESTQHYLAQAKQQVGAQQSKTIAYYQDYVKQINSGQGLTSATVTGNSIPPIPTPPASSSFSPSTVEKLHEHLSQWRLYLSVQEHLEQSAAELNRLFRNVKSRDQAKVDYMVQTKVMKLLNKPCRESERTEAELMETVQRLMT